MSRRTDKVASLFHNEVAKFIQTLELPFLTTVSKVEITPDLKWCKVFVTILGNDDEKKTVIKILLKNRRQLQELVNENMDMKIIPRVRFATDYSVEYAARINELLNEANK
jgi:ribosome-binding factor A